jgi:hypothetical protein
MATLFDTIKMLLPAWISTICIGIIWFFLGALSQFITAFSWVPKYLPHKKTFEFLLVTFPHAVILGVLGSILLMFFAPKPAVWVAWFPVIYGILGIGLFFVRMFFA